MGCNKYPRMNAKRIVKLLGGPVALQDRLFSLGYPLHISTIHAWQSRGQISAQYIPVLMDIGERDGIYITAKDFLPRGKHPVGDMLD